MSIHINLISDHLTPALITVLADKPNISCIYLIHTGAHYEVLANKLKRFYYSKNINSVELIQVNNPNAYADVRQQAEKIYERISKTHPTEYLYLNATGGTKPFAFAFAQAFDKRQQRSVAIYVDGHDNQIVFLTDDQSLKPFKQSEVLSIEDYLKLYEFEFSDNFDQYEKVDKYKTLTQKLAKHFKRSPGALPSINSLIQESGFNNGYLEVVHLSKPPFKALTEILTLLHDNELIIYDGKTITVRSVEDARYICGGWYEELIYFAAEEAELTEVKLNLEAADRNELDVVAINQNTLMIVEAKTINWKQPGAQSVVLNKLDTINRSYGGRFAKAVIMSAHPASAKLKERIEHHRNLQLVETCDYQRLIKFFKDFKNTTEGKQ
ncbi:Card1-like endonuclease domain-containing protein [Paraferrimonas haliotis]|uniref:Card1-like endonuclease domain-containing protein n=1 Tax=Paraferrimonas haliotis TaxID=2013866 RepID=UPI000BA9B21C|nr:DUF1887 family CARF protein [Paraferrimonas haliotis]